MTKFQKICLTLVLLIFIHFTIIGALAIKEVVECSFPPLKVRVERNEPLDLWLKEKGYTPYMEREDFFIAIEEYVFFLLLGCLYLSSKLNKPF